MNAKAGNVCRPYVIITQRIASFFTLKIMDLRSIFGAVIHAIPALYCPLVVLVLALVIAIRPACEERGLPPQLLQMAAMAHGGSDIGGIGVVLKCDGKAVAANLSRIERRAW